MAVSSKRSQAAQRSGWTDQTCKFITSIALFGTVLLPSVTLAGQWQTESNASLISRYNDNPTLAPKSSNPIATSIAVGTYEAEFIYADPAFNFTFTPNVQANYYLDRDLEELDSINFLANTSVTLLREQTTWGINSRISRRNILSSEDTDPNDPDEGGDGNFIRADDNLTLISVSPRATWKISPQADLNSSLSYSIADYDLDFTGRSDFENFSANLFYDWAFSQRHSLGIFGNWFSSDAERLSLIVLCGGEFPPPPGCTNLQVNEGTFENNSSGYSVSLTYKFRFNSLVDINASIGRQSTQLESVADGGTQRISIKSTFASQQYRLSLTTRGERTNWEIGISQAIQPATSDGAPSDRLQANARLQHRFTERISTNLAIVAYRRSSVSSARIRESEFLRTDLSLSWRVARRISISGTYAFRKDSPRLVIFEGRPATAESSLSRQSNSFSVSFRYTFR